MGKNMIQQSNFIEGHLVGIGKIHKDGSQDFRWLEKPIHNRIVSTGLDHLLTLNGNQTTINSDSFEYDSPYPDFNPAFVYIWYGRGKNRNNASNARCGVVHFASYGTSDDPTDFNDTELHNRIGGYSSAVIAGPGYFGTQIPSYGKIKLRFTHKHTSAPNHLYVKELGWFYDIIDANPADYRMFSRVVLDYPYELQEGEQLITSYEISITLDSTTITGNSFFGLFDRDGNPLQYEKRNCLYQNKNFMNWDSTLNYCTINTNSYPIICSNYNYNYDNCMAVLRPAYMSVRRSWQSISYNGNYTHFCPTRITPFQAGNMDNYKCSYDDQSLPNSLLWVVKNYVWGSFYRDMVLTVPSSWPGLANETSYVDINFLLINGVGISFGYDNDGTWVPQYYRKYGSKNLRITVRQSWSTVDTL